MRMAHYIASTHWDREWYDTFQGFRMKLVTLLDEVIETLENDENYRTFVMDGQVIPIYDYLEIRPERENTVKRLLADGRIKIGPWFVLPDEWLVSGESLIRNLETGMRLARELGAESSRAGFLCDMFGHIGQLPQILDQLGMTGALIWRGLNEREHGGQIFWKAPDGTVLPAYRFGRIGYCTYAAEVRLARDFEAPLILDEAVGRLVEFTRRQAKRTPVGPILLFDGGDHLGIEPKTPEMIGRANERLNDDGITIVHSDLDTYLEELSSRRDGIKKTVIGELRETGRDPVDADEQWLIPGVLSSRIRLKQANAACEDELCLWAEPFSAFASECGRDYPEGYLRAAWKHLLENHPHDSICGCSLDSVHRDMEYRFDQSLDISSRIADSALRAIARAAAPKDIAEEALTIAVFNPTAAAIDEPVDLDVALPVNWPVFREFFGFEDKFSFKLKNAAGKEIPWQLVSQRRSHMGFRAAMTKFPLPDERHVIGITARIPLPACGYATLTVERAEGPVRYSGNMTTSHNSMENEYLAVSVDTNGTVNLLDKRTGKTYSRLLTFEERADIGDGWYHGIAVNDRIHTSAASSADVSIVADGLWKAVMRISVTMNVPRRFDFASMERSAETVPLHIVSNITLRAGADRLEVITTVENTVEDHRLRVLFPTGLEGDSYLSDSGFDVVKRPVALAADNDIRRELDVETRPQATWTAFGDGGRGLAVVSRGLPESAVLDTAEHAIALTLFRGFRRAVMTNDNPGGQETGTLTFRYWIVPFEGSAPVEQLFRYGQRVLNSVRTAEARPAGHELPGDCTALPPERSFLALEGNAVLTSVQEYGDGVMVRFFNPHERTEQVKLVRPEPVKHVNCITLDGRPDMSTTVVTIKEGTVELLVPAKRIATIIVE